MKAHKVNETQSFKRGQDPYNQLGLGKYADPKYKEAIDDFMEWSGGFDPTETIWEGDEEEDEDIPQVQWYLDNMIMDKERDDIGDFFEKLVENDLDINDFK